MERQSWLQRFRSIWLGESSELRDGSKKNGEEGTSLGWSMNYFYMMNLKHHQHIGQKYPAWNWKMFETADMSLKVNLSGASNFSSFNMTQCSWTISSTVFWINFPVIMISFRLPFSNGEVGRTMGTYSETM